MVKNVHFDSPFNKLLREFNCLVLEILEYIHILFEVSFFLLVNLFFTLKMQRPKLFIC